MRIYLKCEEKQPRTKNLRTAIFFCLWNLARDSFAWSVKCALINRLPDQEQLLRSTFINHGFYVFLFQLIIPGIWIFSLLLNIPVVLLAWTFDKKSNSCKFIWPEKLMTNPHPEDLKWNILVALTLLVMAVVYSRVMFTLWFQGNDGTQLSHQQKVSDWHDNVQNSVRSAYENTGVLTSCFLKYLHLNWYVNVEKTSK